MIGAERISVRSPLASSGLERPTGGMTHMNPEKEGSVDINKLRRYPTWLGDVPATLHAEVAREIEQNKNLDGHAHGILDFCRVW